MEIPTLTLYSYISIGILLVVYGLLITEKVNKVIVSVLAAGLLVFLQVFKTHEASSQTGAMHFISNNLDVLGFIIGMMILVGIVRESGLFESIAIALVKKVRGNPTKLLVVMGYLTLFMTALLSNIPTVLILTPVILVLVKQLKLPYLPYLFTMVTMANIGGAMTPISDPTTYYQAKTVGLSFLEVIENSGLLVLILSVVVTLYSVFVFRKQLQEVTVNEKDVLEFDPASALKDRKILYWGTPLLIISILLMVLKEWIGHTTGITLDNATITLTAAFVAIAMFNKEPLEIFKHVVDWEIIFFFMGLFVVIGALESNHVIGALAAQLVALTGGSTNALLFVLSLGSGVLSSFIDNVPYNITMVSAVQAMGKAGVFVYPLWWALNLGTSLGGAGSPIGAACNVVACGQAEKEHMHINFIQYLKVGIPLVVINALVTYAVLWVHYLR